MKTVKEMSKLSGVSVRTLHYYDEIGLLTPQRTENNGYRLYGPSQIVRLQQILFFRELGFPLKQIQEILSDPSFDQQKAFESQYQLLTLQRERIDRLLSLLEQNMKGEISMSFSAFDESTIKAHQEKYADEVKTRWGDSPAYAQSNKRTAGYNAEDWKKIATEAGEIFSAFAAVADADPADERVQQLVQRWKDHIDRFYYDCSCEILAGLGQMYLADERFTKNIDQYGAGTASILSRAIEIYCQKNASL